MEDLIKHPLLVIGLLAGIGVTNIINLKLSSDPHARPDPYTGSEGRAVEARVLELERRYNEHIRWGREKAGKWDAQIEELMKHQRSHHKNK